MGARWYDSQIGRWISADTIIPDPANPQSLNRYSYVYNNPIRFRDPSGHVPCLDQECDWTVRPPADRPQLVGEAWGYHLLHAGDGLSAISLFVFVGLEGRATGSMGQAGLPSFLLQTPRIGYEGNPLAHSSVYQRTAGNFDLPVAVFNPTEPETGLMAEYWSVSYWDFGELLAQQAYQIHNGKLFHEVWSAYGSGDEMNTIHGVMMDAMEAGQLPQQVHGLLAGALSQNWNSFVDFGGRQPGDGTRAFAMVALQVQEEPVFDADYPSWDNAFNLGVPVFWSEPSYP